MITDTLDSVVAQLILAARTQDDELFDLRRRAVEKIQNLFRDAVLQHHATNLCDCRGLLVMVGEEVNTDVPRR